MQMCSKNMKRHMKMFTLTRLSAKISDERRECSKLGRKYLILLFGGRNYVIICVSDGSGIFLRSMSKR